MLVTVTHPLRGRILLALFLLISTFTLLSKAAAFPDWTDCPAVCSCKWTSGKKSALCPDAGLTTLPASLDPDMQVLDLSGNNIPELQSEMFKNAGLLNLQRVFLRNAGIREIHVDSFKDMRILVEIDLSDNHITNLETDTFYGNERLRILILSGNPLGALKCHQFPSLQHLRNLELQRCSLSDVHPDALVKLTTLESLKLDNNLLEHLDAKVISSLTRLKTLTLDGNRWRCDCKLRSFRDWLVPVDKPASKLYSVPQMCSGPQRLQGRRWEDVKPVDFACEPRVLLSANSIQEEMNGNFSISCMATGDPQPEIWWQLNGGPLNYTKMVSSGEQQVFGTYISTSTDSSSMTGWSNLTIYNASESDAGEYVCSAKNIAGTTKDSINVAIPRVFTAPTLSQSDNWLLWASLAGGGAVALCSSILGILLSLYLCGGSRRRSRREKVKLQGSTSFGDQEKKLLDLSVTTTNTANSTDRNSGHGSLVEAICTPNDLELNERLSISDAIGTITVTPVTASAAAAAAAANVTVERLRPEILNSGGIRTLPCTATVFPPPPPEFTSGILPTGIFGNIFISVSLPQDSASSDRCYPDLLDIPVHGSIIDKNLIVTPSMNALPIVTASQVSNFATLPRRANPGGAVTTANASTNTSTILRPSHNDLNSPYDNMGPRVTATGSSTFSLTDVDLRLSPPPPPRVIQPPHEFVSL